MCLENSGAHEGLIYSTQSLYKALWRVLGQSWVEGDRGDQKDLLAFSRTLNWAQVSTQEDLLSGALWGGG